MVGPFLGGLYTSEPSTMIPPTRTNKAVSRQDYVNKYIVFKSNVILKFGIICWTWFDGDCNIISIITNKARNPGIQVIVPRYNVSYCEGAFPVSSSPELITL